MLERLGSDVELGRTAIGWVDALALSGDPSGAVRLARRARKYLIGRDPIALARLDGSLATAHHLAGQLDRAARLNADARRRFLRHQAIADASVCSYNLGNVHLLRGDLSKAARSFRTAIRGFDELDSPIPRWHCRYALAAIDLQRGNWDRGSSEMAETADALRAAGDRRGLGAIAHDQAELLAALGSFEQASEAAAEAHRVVSKLGLPYETAKAAALHGAVLARLGRYHDAQHRLAEAESHWKDVGHRWASQRTAFARAKAYVARGRLQDAAQLLRGLQAALDRRDRHGLGAQSRALRAEILLQTGRPGVALRMARTAYREARHYPARLDKPAIALQIARALLATRRGGEAVRWARSAMRAFESQGARLGNRHLRGALSLPRENLTRQAIDVVLEHGGQRAAQTAVELLSVARSPELIEDLLQGDRQLLAEDVRSAIARLRDRLLAGGEEGPEDVRFRSLRGRISELERELAAKQRRLPSIARLAWERRRPGSWIRELGERDLVLMDQGASGWRGFVVEPGRRARWAELPQAEQALRRSWMALRMLLEAAAHAPARHRESLLERTCEEAEGTLTELHEAFWKPLKLSARRNVILCPTAALHGVPLEAAWDIGPSPDSSEAIPSVTRLPHPALLRREGRGRHRHAVLLEGTMPGSSAEVRGIQRQLISAGFRAKIERSRRALGRTRVPIGILHVAAHGAFHRSSWLRSGIRLDDGWLGFEQLRPNQLRDALLFFDSCESGLSLDTPGAQLDGWMGAGLGAGAREFVLTLWKLDDDAAQTFASAFYEGWLTGRSAAEAAQLARRRVRRIRRHPFAWAPFVTVG
jgi:tetratricopeptide (TPR) repeat protein